MQTETTSNSIVNSAQQPSTLAGTVSDLIGISRQHPLQWVVPDVPLEDAVHVLHGDEETFKTMLTIQLHEALTVGGVFLGREVKGGLRTGIAELEMKGRIFGDRLRGFFHSGPIPDIRVLPEELRRKVLAGSTARTRIEVIANWSESEGLQFVSIDSASKLFPPGCDPSRADLASEVFSQLQKLPTLTRPDRRAPLVEFSWGKMRTGEKSDPLTLFFDRVDYRLYPFHPYFHLLSKRPMQGYELVVEAERRYGWKERRAREYLASLCELVNENGDPCVAEQNKGHNKEFRAISIPRRLLKAPGS